MTANNLFLHEMQRWAGIGGGGGGGSLIKKKIDCSNFILIARTWLYSVAKLKYLKPKI